MSNRIRVYKELLDRVEDGFKYFDYRLEEMNTDDKFYITSFMDYIEYLEKEVDKLNKTK